MPDPSVQKFPELLFCWEVSRLSPWKQLFQMINNVSLSSEGKELRLGDKNVYLFSKKREHCKIREKSNFYFDY